MGMFDFIKEAGAALSDTLTKVSEEGIKQKLKESGLEMADLNVRMLEEGKMKVYAVVPDQATREKIVLMVGNTQGVTGVEDAIKVRVNEGAPAEKEAKFYTVKSGDTLSAISQQFYGDPNRYNEIFEANRPMLKSADAIDVGQVLRIPV